MSRNNGTRSPAPRNKGGSMFAGIVLGMVLGVAIAGGVAWYILKLPSPFVNKGQRHELSDPQAAPAGEPQTPASSPATAATAAPAAAGDNGKPRFEFYKVLTDKQDGSLPAQQAPAQPAAPAAPAATKAAPNQASFLQAGSFSSEGDADKVKAKLALLGMEASVQTVTIPGKGVWHRVRLGPYRNSDEMNKARATLKQNGVDATPMRDQ
ncbi:MAG: SPOR domain-containing protein [Sideroxydans sp.]|nr:SPOR domain-containing protein [Sideroxydans sp.]